MKKLLTSLTAVLAGSTLWAQIYTVTSTSDANTAGTLRHAINEVNAGNNTDIHFNISGTAPFTIALGSALPQIANPVNIDGTTQSGYVSTPIITVDGQDASIDGFVFLVGTSGSSVIGLEITGMGYPDATSTQYYGVKDWDRATVQDNVINNCKNGIYSDAGTKIYGNYIGLNSAGSQAVPNKIGVVADAGAEIGKVGSAFRNVISGNDMMGVYAGMSTIKNNYIGVNASGSFAIPNEVGVGIYNSSVELGGHLVGEGNVISGNSGDGVRVEAGRFIIIDGNYIGTNASGDNLGNGGHGVYMEASGGLGPVVKHNWVGKNSSTLGIGNTIRFNGGDGIHTFSHFNYTFLFGADNEGNLFSGNLISDHPNGKPINLNYNYFTTGFYAGNRAEPFPLLTSYDVSLGSVSGTTSPVQTAIPIELYKSNAAGDALQLLAEATTDGSGNWYFTGIPLSSLDYIVVLQSGNLSGYLPNTSELSPPTPIISCEDIDLSAAFTVNPDPGVVNQNVTITYTGNGANIVSHVLDWGDGTIVPGGALSNGTTFTHQYPSSGPMTISLSVTSNNPVCTEIETYNLDVNDCCESEMDLDPAGGETVSEVGQFYFDNQTGRLVLVKHDCPAQFSFDCVRRPVQLQGASGVIAASMKTMSDVWPYDLDYYPSPNNALNPNEFETAIAGKWRTNGEYTYNEELDLNPNLDYKNYDRGTFDMAMFDWDYPSNNDPDKWIKTRDVQYYTPNGFVEQDRNPRGVFSTAIYGYDKQLMIGVATRARRYGVQFESYERFYPHNWGRFENDQWFQGNGGIHTDENPHAGNWSIKLKPPSTPGLGFHIGKVKLDNHSVAYGMVVRTWIWLDKSKPGFETAGKDIQASIDNQNNSSGWVNIGSWTKIADAGEWMLYEKFISNADLLAAGFSSNTNFPNDMINIQLIFLGWGSGANDYALGDIYIDDVRVAPKNAVMESYVYDNQQKLLARFDDQHFGLFFQYNAEGSLVRKLKETVNGVKTLSETNYNSQGTVAW